MNVACSIALDALSAVFMLVLLLSFGSPKRRRLRRHRFFRIILAVLCFLLLDILYMLLYGSASELGHTLTMIVKSAYFIVNSIIICEWGKYIDCIVFGEENNRRHSRVYHILLGINVLLILFNLPFGIMFDVAPEGVLRVQPAGMWAFTLCNYLSLVFAMAVLIRHRAKVNPHQFPPLLLFHLPPLLAELLQTVYRPFSLICTYAISILVVYQIVQNNTLHTDELTGLANRRTLNERLDRWFTEPRGMMVCGIMMDLDNLKRINDTYGHLSGDYALITMADMLREVKHRDAIPARYAGDEFMMIWLSPDGRDLPAAVRALEEARERINRTRKAHERIEFSIGQFCCPDDGILTSAGFMDELDCRMYACKNAKKQDGAPGEPALPMA